MKKLITFFGTLLLVSLFASCKPTHPVLDLDKDGYVVEISGDQLTRLKLANAVEISKLSQEDQKSYLKLERKLKNEIRSTNNFMSGYLSLEESKGDTFQSITLKKVSSWKQVIKPPFDIAKKNLDRFVEKNNIDATKLLIYREVTFLQELLTHQGLVVASTEN